MNGCLLPQLFAALQVGGTLPILPEPMGLDHPPPPSSTKTVLGERMSKWVDSENFTVQWDDPQVSNDEAEQISADMEAAWQSLVVEQGWHAPASGEQHLIRVVLDEDIEATGVTTGYPTDAYPTGLPIIYINTMYAEETEFISSLCAHEFAHALQFRVRDWYSGGPEEAWFWEASSEWLSERARPDMDTYAYSSTWYASSTETDHFSISDWHHYGMFVVIAFLEEFRLGNDGLRDIWTENDGLGWIDEIQDAVGEDIGWFWADFTGAYGSGALRESDLYTAVLPTENPGTIDGWLGTEYFSLGAVEGGLTLSDGMGALIREGTWVSFENRINVPAGDGEVWLAVTNADSEPLRYSWSVGEAFSEDELEDTGEPDTGEPPEIRVVEPVDFPTKGCACSARGRQAGAGWIPLFLGLCVARRRRDPCDA